METREKIILAIVIVVVVSLVWFFGNRECLNGHTEKQLKMPMGIVVGGGQYGGGVSVPIGNAREVEVFVCDEYK